MVKGAERMQRTFGGSWEQTMRNGRVIATGTDDPRMRQLETIWRDASTPTVAQKADASVKKFTAGIVPLRQTREDLGYTDTQIGLMEGEDAKALESNPLNVFARQQEAVSAAGGTELQEAG